MKMKTRILSRMATIDIAQTDAITKLMDVVDANNLISLGCQNVLDCWRDANNSGIITEQYASFDDWVNDYGEAVANEVMFALQDDKTETGDLYAMLGEEARDELMTRVLEKLKTSDLSSVAVFFNEG